jgi:hypothetical protein
MITKVSSAEFIADLKQRPEYAHINIDNELWKMDRWLARHPGRVKTKLFITKWLDKIVPPTVQVIGKLDAGKMFLDVFGTTAWNSLDKRLISQLTNADIRAIWKHGESLPTHRKQFFTFYNLAPPMD